MHASGPSGTLKLALTSRGSTAVRAFLSSLLRWLIVLAITLAGIEVGLKLSPDLIPLSLLKSYQRDVRLDIARKRGLWNEGQMVEVPRDDGGPRLTVFAPNATIESIFRDTGEPIALAMDANGFCNPPGDLSATSKTDIIALGNSFTVCTGTGATETWVHLLGRMTGRPAYNLGRGGIGPYDYLQILIRFGMAMRPDIVIMNIYEGNDLRDSLRYRKFVEAAAAGRPIVADAADRGVGEKAGVVLDNPLGRRSYAINLVVAGIDEAVKATGKGFKRALGRASAPINFRYRFDFAGQQVPFNLENTDLSEVEHARALKDGRNLDRGVHGCLGAFCRTGPRAWVQAGRLLFAVGLHGLCRIRGLRGRGPRRSHAVVQPNLARLPRREGRGARLYLRRSDADLAGGGKTAAGDPASLFPG